jgi:hypothetical protein
MFGIRVSCTELARVRCVAVVKSLVGTLSGATKCGLERPMLVVMEALLLDRWRGRRRGRRRVLRKGLHRGLQRGLQRGLLRLSSGFALSLQRGKEPLAKHIY